MRSNVDVTNPKHDILGTGAYRVLLTSELQRIMTEILIKIVIINY